MDDKWEYPLGARVSLLTSDEQGEIIGRAEYKEGPSMYLVLYKSGAGRQVEEWWSASKLKKVEE